MTFEKEQEIYLKKTLKRLYERFILEESKQAKLEYFFKKMSTISLLSLKVSEN